MTAGNILVVDDEVKLRNLLKRIISLEGYTVYEAADVRNAWKLMNKEDIDVVVCDVKLPDGSGLDFTRSIKVRLSPVEVILLTAHATIPDVVQAMRSGAFSAWTAGGGHAYASGDVRVAPLSSSWGGWQPGMVRSESRMVPALPVRF